MPERPVTALPSRRNAISKVLFSYLNYRLMAASGMLPGPVRAVADRPGPAASDEETMPMCDDRLMTSPRQDRNSGLSRRSFLNAAGTAAMATLLNRFPGLPQRPAARPVAADGTSAYSMAMHVHSSFSEEDGSMASQLFRGGHQLGRRGVVDRPRLSDGWDGLPPGRAFHQPDQGARRTGPGWGLDLAEGRERAADGRVGRRNRRAAPGPRTIPYPEAACTCPPRAGRPPRRGTATTPTLTRLYTTTATTSRASR